MKSNENGDAWPSRMRHRDASTLYLEMKHGCRVSPETLAKYAVIGIGPEAEYRGRNFRPFSRAVGPWVEARSLGAVRSTSEAKKTRSQRSSRARRVKKATSQKRSTPSGGAETVGGRPAKVGNPENHYRRRIRRGSPPCTLHTEKQRTKAIRCVVATARYTL